uniref:ALG11_N domain-containing protein n=1 Tax=Echinostoma caproni TaxID=27848 RepID=A0A183AS15_9TREM
LISIIRYSVRKALVDRYGLTADFSLVTFFHPFCTSRGGGERVLWAAIKSMQSYKSKPIVIVVYTQDSQCLTNRKQVLNEVKQTFGVQLDSKFPLHFVLLSTTRLLTPQMYPVLTLAGQALGSMLVAYAHYPTVSVDMLNRLSVTGVTYNNASWIRNSRFMTRVKLSYYRLMLGAYSWVGSPTNVDCVMTNSTWTRNHIRSLWTGYPVILYPPCPTEDLAISSSGKRQPWIMSVSQFRPEKNHEVTGDHSYRLLLIGGCRDETDSALATRLRELVRVRGLQDVVQFHINVSYSTLKRYFYQCMINLHTMVDEHFGIGKFSAQMKHPQTMCTISQSESIHTNLKLVRTLCSTYLDDHTSRLAPRTRSPHTVRATNSSRLLPATEMRTQATNAYLIHHKQVKFTASICLCTVRVSGHRP